MSIVGIESVTYGVDDLKQCTRFYEDFGLVLTSQSEEHSEFTLEEGSRVVLRERSHPALPHTWFEGPGVRETVFGVDSPESLDALSKELGRDRELLRDASGTVHFATDDGVPFGLKVLALPGFRW